MDNFNQDFFPHRSTMGFLEHRCLYLYPMCWNTSKSRGSYIQGQICELGPMDTRTNTGEKKNLLCCRGNHGKIYFKGLICKLATVAHGKNECEFPSAHYLPSLNGDLLLWYAECLLLLCPCASFCCCLWIFHVCFSCCSCLLKALTKCFHIAAVSCREPFNVYWLTKWIPSPNRIVFAVPNMYTAPIFPSPAILLLETLFYNNVLIH